MSFKATISDQEKQQLWFRAINVLSTIHEDIRLTISSSELIAWSINSTDTTLCKVRFSSQFFEYFDFQPHEIIFGESGAQTVKDSEGSDHRLYSLQLNGRHLSTISRKPESDAVKNFTIAIDNTSTCPETLANRLLVHVEMESLIRKEYAPQFQPIKYDPIIIDLKYKRKFLEVYGMSAKPSSMSSQEQLDPKLVDIFTETDQELSKALFNEGPRLSPRKEDKLTVADEINYICCNQALLKNFIDNCNTNITEEVKIEINVHKLIVSAFTKAIYGKNNDVLRSNMSLSNTICVADLEHYCLFTTVDEEDSNAIADQSNRKGQSKAIVFKLKDFKNFLNAGSTWKTAQNDNLSIWFCHSGDPILIEIIKPGVKLELVQVTDTNGVNVTDEMPSANSEVAIKKTISPEKIAHQAVTEDTGVRISPLKYKKYTNGMKKSPLKESPVAVTSGVTRRKLFVTDEATSIASDAASAQLNWTNPLGEWANDDHIGMEPTEMAGDPSKAAPVRAERTSTTIEWGKRPPEQQENLLTMDKQSVLKREKLKYCRALNETKRQKSQPEEKPDGLGPTQLTRPKGLFD